MNSNSSLRIGVIAPLSGLTVGGDNLGQGFANGVTLAQEEYIKNNPDKKIEVYIEDDGYDAKKGASAYQKLTSINNINALINLSSPTIDAVTGNVHETKIPVVQLGAESVISTDNIYQIYPDQTAIGVIGEVANKDGVKNVVVAMQQLQAYEKFVSDFDSQYSGEINIQKVSASEKDMSSLALKIKEINPEGLLIFMGSKEGGQLIKKLNDLGYKPAHIYFDGSLQLGMPDYLGILGNLNSLNGAKALYSVSETNTDFKVKYEARFKAPLGVLSGYGYDSYMTMVKNYDSNPEKWQKNMNSYKAEGVSGKISFSESGVRPPEWKIAEVKGGELVVQ